MSELEPLEFKANVPDITSFSTFAVRRRSFTPAEQAVYNEADSTWAMLSEREKVALYIHLVDGRFAKTVNQVFLETAINVKAQARDIDDPEIASLAESFRRELLTEHANHQMAYYRTTAMKFTEVLSEPLTPPIRPQGFLERIAAALVE